jgi:hypothetical protein
MSDAPSPTSVLLIPMHLDALVVGEPRNAAAPMADFTRLPHHGGQRERHAAVPWLGEAVASRPFQEPGFRLERGTHLHWSLPAALCRGARGKGADLAFPAVPDRWLVTRGRQQGGAHTIDRWVVESTYLHPIAAQLAGPKIAFPVPIDLHRDPGPPRVDPPFRRMGRARPLAEYLADRAHNSECLREPLTALGYGEPAFAAFYPNSHSVFGFHDPDLDTLVPDPLYYEVLGWYDDPERDHLRHLLALADAASEAAGSSPAARLHSALAGLRWAAEGTPAAAPRLVCHARLTFNATQNPPLIAPVVTFGNNIAEALSACLATTGSAGDPVKKAEIEDQLEAVLLASRLDPRDPDIGPKFSEARHARGFASAPPAYLWAVRPAADAPASDDPGAAPDWPDAAHLLDALNTLQRAYNDAWDQIRAARRQLVSDWHKYMLCAHPPEGSASEYPDADEVRSFIERDGLPALTALLAATGELIVDDEPGQQGLRTTADSPPGSLAARIVAAATTLHACLVQHAVKPPPKLAPGAPPPMLAIEPVFVLQRLVAPRCFQPSEPVLLLTGDAVATHHRHAHAGPVDADGNLLGHWVELAGEVSDNLETLADTLTRDQLWDTHTVSGSPWHPFSLEWEVELRPFERLANHSAADGRYDPDFIVRNFTLKRGDADFTPRADRPRLARHGHVYSGTSLLTPHGVEPYIDALARELAREQAGAHDPEHAPLPPATRDRLVAALAQLRDLSSMAQALGGFNDALVMNRQMLQLPIDDPLGFPDEREFAARVRLAAGEGVHRSPQPAHGFTPIRTGELRLLRLRILDVFGQSLDLDCPRLTCHSPATLPKRDGPAVLLPPRLAQPARLQFRWLAAAGLRGETNAHPGTTPVCGWIVLNHADRSLFVHASDGQALAYLDTSGTRVRWTSAPGRAPPIASVDRLDNPALRRLVRFLLASDATYFAQFLIDLEAAQARSEPGRASEALLVGRPLALVRASLQLHLQGPPAVHQGWHELLIDMRSRGRSHDGFTAVRFPIRLGEQDQLGDGLAVYFEEDDRGRYDGYVIPNYDSAGSADQDPLHRKCDYLYQSAAASALTVTMLVDPRGKVHATTGILPIKAIDLPPVHYEAALQRLGTSFLAAPVLADRQADGPISLPIPDEPGQRWTFVEPGAAAPREVKPGALHAPLAAPVAIREGWLRLTHDPKAPRR